MISWPKRAADALRALFQPLQDIDVFVEDANDEVFYTRLLARVAHERVRIARVFAKGGREAVIEAARVHDFTQRRALFVIDGDLDLVAGIPAPRLPGLYRLDAYCVENYLVCKKAAIQVLVEELVIEAAAADALLDFEGWIGDVSEPLTRLFAAFGTVRRIHPEVRTVSQKVTKLLTDHRLDPAKADAARASALQAIEAIAPRDQIEALDDEIYASIRQKPVPLDVVSGKDFLLPLLDLRLRSHGCKIARRTLRFRLAIHCDTVRLSSLLTALEKAARA